MTRSQKPDDVLDVIMVNCRNRRCNRELVCRGKTNIKLAREWMGESMAVVAGTLGRWPDAKSYCEACWQVVIWGAEGEVNEGIKR
jgi:hypothetical protein